MTSLRPNTTVLVAAVVGALVAQPHTALGESPAAPSPLSTRPTTPLGMLMASIEAAVNDLFWVKPTPISVSYRVRRIASIDLGAPMLALAAADFDQDGKDELYAATTDEVIVAQAHPRMMVLARLPYPAPTMPTRVPVATLERSPSSPPAILARASTRAKGLRVVYAAGQWRADGEVEDFLACGERQAVVAGRNHFGELEAPIFAERCRGVADADGAPITTRATLGADGQLRIAATCASCKPVRNREWVLSNVGTAFAVDDINRDGTLEVATSAHVAPGDGDEVRVFAPEPAAATPLLRRKFAGGVIGIVSADVDGDRRLEFVCAVRLPGSNKVDLWRLN